MAVGTRRCIADAPRDRLSVNAVTKRRENIRVAFTAGLRNMRARNLRRGIDRGSNRVSAVTISTNSPVLSGGDGARVNALRIGFNGTHHRNPEFFRELRIGVAHGTGGRNVLRIYRRGRVRMGTDLMNVSVAACARCRFSKPL